MKAPRLIARSSVALVRWATPARTARLELGEIDRDLATTPNPFVHLDRTFLSLFNGQGCSRRRRVACRPLLVGTAPAGV